MKPSNPSQPSDAVKVRYTGGMDIGDYYWGLYRDHYRDPFPHSLLRTKQIVHVTKRLQSDSNSATLRGAEQQAPSSAKLKSPSTFAKEIELPAEAFRGYSKGGLQTAAM